MKKKKKQKKKKKKKEKRMYKIEGRRLGEMADDLGKQPMMMAT